MNDEPKSTTEENPEIDEKDRDETYEKLTLALKQLQPGYKIAIKRVKPGWCRGHLETIDVYDPSDPDSQIDIDYLIEQWGGHNLQLLIHSSTGKWVTGVNIPLYTYPPKRHGKLLVQSDVYNDLGNNLSSRMYQNSNQNPIPNSAPQGTGFDINQLVMLMAKQKNADLGTVLKLAEYFKTQQPQISTPAQNITEQMLSMVSLFKEMKGILGEFGATESSDSSNDMMPIFGELLRGMMNQNQRSTPENSALSRPRRKIEGPKSIIDHEIDRKIDNIINDEDNQKPKSPPSSKQKNILTIAQDLSQLSPDDAAGAVLLAMDQMDDSQRNAAMQAFFEATQDGSYGEDDENIDELSDSVNNIYRNEDQ